MLAGATATGLGSLVGWACSAGGLAGGGGFRHMLGDTWPAAQGQRDSMGTVIFVLAVVAGLCVALHWIYGRLEEISKRTVRMAMHVVLDVQGDYAAANDSGGDASSASDGDGGTQHAPNRIPDRVWEQFD